MILRLGMLLCCAVIGSCSPGSKPAAQAPPAAAAPDPGSVAKPTPGSAVEPGPQSASTLPAPEVLSAARPLSGITLRASGIGEVGDTDASDVALAASVHARDPAQDPAAARDGFLDTGYRCRPDAAGRCVLWFRFEHPAQLRSLRLFAGDGASREAFTRSAVPATLRLHLPGGYVQARLPRKRRLQRLLLSRPVTASEVGLEIVDTDDSKRAAEAVLSEVELFGPEGPAREPFALTAADVLVGFDGKRFAFDLETQSYASHAWLVSARGHHRLMRGGDLRPTPQARYLIVDDSATVSCPGAYEVSATRLSLLDLTTRRLLLLGSFPVVSSWYLAHREADDALLLIVDDPIDHSRALQLDLAGAAASVKPVEVPGLANGPASEALAAAGITRTQAPAGASPHPPSEGDTCGPPSKAVLAVLAKDGYFGSSNPLDKQPPDRFRSCRVHRFDVVMYRGFCEDGHAIWVLDGGKIITKRIAGGTNYGYLWRDGAGSVNIAIDSDDGDAGDLYRVTEAGKLEVVLKNATYRVAAPAGCRCSA